MNQITTQSIKLRFMILFAIFIPITILFAIFPEIDLTITKAIYDKNQSFALREILLFRALSYSSKVVVAVLLGGSLILVLYQYYKTRKFEWRKNRNALFLLLVFAIGPGLGVKGILKEVSHRPRPYATEEFGGSLPFSDITEFGRGACIRNCSFPSGHAAVGYFFISLAFLPALYRKRYIIEAAGWSIGLMLGASRVLTGYHFLSDILFSGFFVYIIVLACYLLLFSNIKNIAKS